METGGGGSAAARWQHVAGEARCVLYTIPHSVTDRARDRRDEGRGFDSRQVSDFMYKLCVTNRRPKLGRGEVTEVKWNVIKVSQILETGVLFWDQPPHGGGGSLARLDFADATQ
jgi:hypothetical protein